MKTLSSWNFKDPLDLPLVTLAWLTKLTNNTLLKWNKRLGTLKFFDSSSSNFKQQYI